MTQSFLTFKTLVGNPVKIKGIECLDVHKQGQGAHDALVHIRVPCQSGGVWGLRTPFLILNTVVYFKQNS